MLIRTWTGSFVLVSFACSGNFRRELVYEAREGEWVLSVCGRVVQLEALTDFVIEPRMGVTAMPLAVLLCRDLVRFLLECDAYVRCDRQSYGRLWHSVQSTCRDGGSTGSLLAGFQIVKCTVGFVPGRMSSDNEGVVK